MKNTVKLYEDIASLMVDGLTGDYKSILIKSMAYYENKRQNRFDMFTNQLLKGTATKEKIEYEKRIQNSEDEYYALLSAAVDDEEKEKAYIYANTYRSILEERVPKEKYKRIIKIAKALPYSAIELLPLFYIYKHNHTQFMSLKKFSKSIFEKCKYEVNILTQFNILINPPSSWEEAIPHINKPFFDEIINAFFKEEDLKPEKHGIPVWKDKKALIYTNDPFGEGYDIDAIKPILNELLIQSEAKKYIFGHEKNFSHIIFNMDNNEDISVMIDDIEKCAENHKIIKISFKYVAGTLDVLNLNNKNDIEKFKKEFSD